MKITVTTPIGKFSSGEEPEVPVAERAKYETQLLTLIMSGRCVLKQATGFTYIHPELLKQSVVDIEW